MWKSITLSAVIVSSLAGCATRYYHNELRETSQQYRHERVVLEKISDRFYAFAVDKAKFDHNQVRYYLIGEKYIYRIQDGVWNPDAFLQKLDPKYLKFPQGQVVSVALNADDPAQGIDVNYTLEYLRHKTEVSEQERAGLRALIFKVDHKKYYREIKSMGNLIQKNDVNLVKIENLQYFTQSYPILIEVYQQKTVKDGKPILNNMKGYGIAATVDLITLPLQLFSF